MTQKLSVKNFLIFKPSRKWATILTVATTVIAGAYLYSLSRSRLVEPVSYLTPTTQASTVTTVTALGRLEPEGEVIQLFAPATIEKIRIDQLLVKEGDRVRAGQVIAILESQERLQIALKQAEQQVEVAKFNLEIVRSGAKKGEIEAQKAIISRLEADLVGQPAVEKAKIARLKAELHNARTERERYRTLYQQGAISASDFDNKRLKMETLREQIKETQATLKQIITTRVEQINEAKATLDRLAEIRPVDLQKASAEVESAMIAVEQAQAELDLAYVRTPRDGQILKINTWPGEVVGDNGIVELGQTDRMYVVAEIYETDISQVNIGQKATITSNALTDTLEGDVVQIGKQIYKKDIFSTNPAADVDARIVEVKIRLSPSHSQRVANLTRLQVQVAIEI